MGSEKGCGVFFDAWLVDWGGRMMGPNSDDDGGGGESQENHRKRGLSHLLHHLEIGCCSLMIAMEVDSWGRRRHKVRGSVERFYVFLLIGGKRKGIEGRS